MPRLAAFILLADIAVAMRGPRAATPLPTPRREVRPLSPAECRLLFMPSPSKARH